VYLEKVGGSTVLKKGVIVPLEALSAEWEEGAGLEVARADASPLDPDAWANFMNRLCADSPVEEEEAMRRVIEGHRQQAKAQMGRDMKLSL